MPRKRLTAVMLIGAVLGAIVAGASAAACAAPSDQPHSANRGWYTPPRDAFAQLD